MSAAIRNSFTLILAKLGDHRIFCYGVQFFYPIEVSEVEEGEGDDVQFEKIFVNSSDVEVLNEALSNVLIRAVHKLVFMGRFCLVLSSIAIRS